MQYGEFVAQNRSVKLLIERMKFDKVIALLFLARKVCMYSVSVIEVSFASAKLQFFFIYASARVLLNISRK